MQTIARRKRLCMLADVLRRMHAHKASSALTWPAGCCCPQRELYACIDDLFGKLKEASSQAAAAGQPLDSFELFGHYTGVVLQPRLCNGEQMEFCNCIQAIALSQTLSQAGGCDSSISDTLFSRRSQRWAPASHLCRCRSCRRRQATGTRPARCTTLTRTATWGTRRRHRRAHFSVYLHDIFSGWPTGLLTCANGSSSGWKYEIQSTSKTGATP